MALVIVFCARLLMDIVIINNSIMCRPSATYAHNSTEQLFTCKLRGQKPTNSGKLPTHSRYFAQMVGPDPLVFVILWQLEIVAGK